MASVSHGKDNAVYTCITGEYDQLRPPLVTVPGVQYTCFTDRPRHTPPWEAQPFPQLLDTPARNSRIPRCLPHLLLDCAFSVYHDGAFQLRSDPQDLVELLGDADVALFKHPFGHRSIHDERQHYITHRGGLVPRDIEDHYQRYVAQGLPDIGMFWAGGVVVRRHNANVERFNEVWFREYASGCSNDQFALYAAVIKSGVTVKTINENILVNPRFRYHYHAQDSARTGVWADRMRRIQDLAAIYTV